jgi:hypothetical protein
VRAAGGEADSSSKQPAKPTHMNPSPSNALNVTRRQLQRLRHDSEGAQGIGRVRERARLKNVV